MPNKREMNRRKFLKLGTAAVAGLGAAAAVANPAVAAAVNGSYKEAPGKRSNVTWGMVIDCLLYTSEQRNENRRSSGAWIL